MASGNFGNVKPVSGGVPELRIVITSLRPPPSCRLDRALPRHPADGRLQLGIGGRLGSEQVAGFKSDSVADIRRKREAYASVKPGSRETNV
jgi:hypothetical protein